MLTQRSGNAEIAWDLLHEVFIVLLKRMRERELDDPAKLAGFVFNTARFVWLGYVRKETRRNTHPASESIEQFIDEQQTAHDEAIERSQRRQAVEDLLNELPQQRDRDVLRRTYLYGQEKEVICQHLALDAAHFDRVIHRARQRFRKLVETREVFER